MSNLKQEILEKGLHGEASTDSSLPARDERLLSSVRTDRVLEEIDGIFGHDGDLRFLGNLDDQALWAQNSSSDPAPVLHPLRHRKLIQRLMYFGADVLAEGTNAQISTASTISTDNVVVDHLNGQSGLILVLSNVLSAGGTPVSFGTYEVDPSTTGDTITLTSDPLDTSDTRRYFWTVIRPNPVPLVPFPSGGDLGEAKMYLATLPGQWPIYGVGPDGTLTYPSKDSFSLDEPYDGERDATGTRPVISLTNTTATNHLVPGDFVAFDDRVFVVKSSTLDDPNDVETIIVSPLYGFDIGNERLGSGGAIDVLYRVEEATSDPTAPLDVGESSLVNSKWLDWIRVHPLVGPSHGVDAKQGRSSDGMIRAGSIEDDLGFAMVLYPDDGTGSPDLSNPVWDFDSAVIDPTVEEEQEIHVDYQDGYVRLSHPIGGAGSDLNPNGFVDSTGRPRLYATFFAYNGGVVPEASSQLSVGTENRALLPIYDPRGGAKAILKHSWDKESSLNRETLPIESRPGWVIRDSLARFEGMYHSGDSAPEYGGEDEAFLIGMGDPDGYPMGLGVNQRFQRRNVNQGFYQLGGFGWGHVFGGPGNQASSEFAFFPNLTFQNQGQQQYDWGGHPNFRVGDGSKAITGTAEANRHNVPESTFVGVVNDARFDIVVGPFHETPDQIASAVESAISSAVGTEGGDFSVTAVEGGRIQIRAEEFLWIGDGTLNDVLGFTDDTLASSDDLYLGFGSGQNLYDELAWNSVDRDLSGDIRDIRLNGSDVSDAVGSLRGIAESGDDHNPRYVESGFGLVQGYEANEFSPFYIDLSAGRVRHRHTAQAEGVSFSELTFEWAEARGGESPSSAGRGIAPFDLDNAGAGRAYDITINGVNVTGTVTGGSSETAWNAADIILGQIELDSGGTLTGGPLEETSHDFNVVANDDGSISIKATDSVQIDSAGVEELDYVLGMDELLTRSFQKGIRLYLEPSSTPPFTEVHYVFFDEEEGVLNAVSVDDPQFDVRFIDGRVPLYRVVMADGGVGQRAVVVNDVRDWGVVEPEDAAFTVGATKGRFRDLASVLLLISDAYQAQGITDYSTDEEQGMFHVEIVEDLEVALEGTQISIPPNVAIDGNGHRVEFVGTAVDDLACAFQENAHDVLIRNLRLLSPDNRKELFGCLGSVSRIRFEDVILDNSGVTGAGVGNFFQNGDTTTVYAVEDLRFVRCSGETEFDTIRLETDGMEASAGLLVRDCELNSRQGSLLKLTDVEGFSVRDSVCISEGSFPLVETTRVSRGLLDGCRLNALNDAVLSLNDRSSVRARSCEIASSAKNTPDGIITLDNVATPDDYTELVLEDCTVWAKPIPGENSAGLMRAFTTGINPENLRLVFRGCRVLAPIQSKFGDSVNQTTSCQLVFDNSLVHTGFDYDSSSINAHLRITNTQFGRFWPQLDLISSADGYDADSHNQVWIRASNVQLKIAEMGFRYNAAHAHGNDGEEDYDLLFENCHGQVQGLTAGSSHDGVTYGGTNSSFTLLYVKGGTSTVHFSALEIDQPEAFNTDKGMWVRSGTVIVEGLRLKGPGAGTSVGLQLGEAAVNTVVESTVTGIHASGYTNYTLASPHPSGSGDVNRAIDVSDLGQTTNCVVSNGVVDAGGGASNIANDETSNKIDIEHTVNFTTSGADDVDVTFPGTLIIK